MKTQFEIIETLETYIKALDISLEKEDQNLVNALLLAIKQRVDSAIDINIQGIDINEKDL